MPTWEVNEGQVIHVFPTDLKADRVERKGQLPLLQVLRRGVQEEIAVGIGIENRALSAANSVCDERIVKDGIAKFDLLGLGQLNTVLVFYNSERDYATPRLIGARQLAFSRTPVR
jgi:hypothetical protein